MKIEEIKSIFKLRFPDAAKILCGQGFTSKHRLEANSLWLGFKEAWILNKLYHIDFREDKPACSQCGKHLQNLKIKANETGCYYCSEGCCKENIIENKEIDEIE